MNIDISTNEKKHELYELFCSFNFKGEIYKYFGVSDNAVNVNYINQIAEEIGFNFDYYKEKKKKFCLNCGKELKKGQNKFCCQSCAATYNNKHRQVNFRKREERKKLKKDGKITSEKVKRIKEEKEKKRCLRCGKELNKWQKMFCSNECCQDYRADEEVKKWLITGNCGKKCDGAIPKRIREYLLERNNYKCCSCGFEGYNKATGNSILQFHHIDGDAYNNNIENIEVLCPNCHAMTENFMNLNKGKSTRTNRYKKGE